MNQIKAAVMYEYNKPVVVEEMVLPQKHNPNTILYICKHVQ